MIKSLVVSAFLLALMTPATIYADGHASPAVEAAIDALKDHIDNHVGEGQLDDQDKDGLKDFAKSLEEAARGEHQEGGCENCAGDVMTEISDWTSNLEWSDGQDQGEFVMALMDLYSDLENAIHQEENESHEGEHHEGQGPTFADVDTDQDGVISEDEASEAFGHEDDFEEKFAEVENTILHIQLTDEIQSLTCKEVVEKGIIPNKFVAYYLGLLAEFYQKTGIDLEKSRFRKLGDKEKAF